MAVLQVGKDGKAPAGAKVGDTIKTAGGDYKITGGTAGNWTSVKVTTPTSGSSGSSSSSGSGSSGSKTVTVGSSGNAPANQSVGTIVKTAGGDYQIVDKNTPGASYNAASGYYSIKVPSASGGSVVQDNKAGQQSQPPQQQQKTNISIPTGATKTTYTNNGKQVEGYIKDGKTYDMQGKEAAAGSIVESLGKKYLKLATGQGVDITNATESRVYDKSSEDDTKYDLSNALRTLYNVNGVSYDPESGQAYKNVARSGQIVQAQNGKYYDALTGQDVTAQVTSANDAVSLNMANQELPQQIADLITQLGVNTTPTDVLKTIMSWEQAWGQANQSLGSQYAQAFDSAMSQLDKNALQSGFFGQLPTEALKRETAGKLEIDKLNAINSLASQLLGQSEESAYNMLNAKTSEQQNKINTLMQLLGIYTNERGYADSQTYDEWEKAFKEASLTGMYNGQPTLDYLAATTKKTSGSSGGGSGSSGDSDKEADNVMNKTEVTNRLKAVKTSVENDTSISNKEAATGMAYYKSLNAMYNDGLINKTTYDNYVLSYAKGYETSQSAVDDMLSRWWKANTNENFIQRVRNALSEGSLTKDQYEAWSK